jgi:hypothetical protein
MRLSEALTGLGRPIAYFPNLAKFLGGVKAALLFCQLWYWSQRANKEFWKSLDELADELGMTFEELRAARKGLAEMGLVQTRYARIEHRLYFRVDEDRLNDLWDAWVTRDGHLGNSQMADGKVPDGDVGKAALDLSDPEITAETTQISEQTGCHLRRDDSRKAKSETESVIPEDLFEAWNEICPPLGMGSVRELSNSRRALALARIREHPDQAFWELVFGRIKSSVFLQGKAKNNGEKPFQASFDWLIKNDTNVLKIFEGKYDG